MFCQNCLLACHPPCLASLRALVCLPNLLAKARRLCFVGLARPSPISFCPLWHGQCVLLVMVPVLVPSAGACLPFVLLLPAFALLCLCCSHLFGGPPCMAMLTCFAGFFPVLSGAKLLANLLLLLLLTPPPQRNRRSEPTVCLLLLLVVLLLQQ